MIFRDVWDRVPNPMKLALEPMPRDGVVVVTRHRAVRMEQPTVGLLYSSKGTMSALEDGVPVDIVDGHESIEEGVVQEIDMVKSEEGTTNKLVRRRARMLKMKLNPMDVVGKAMASATGDLSVTPFSGGSRSAGNRLPDRHEGPVEGRAKRGGDPVRLLLMK